MKLTDKIENLINELPTQSKDEVVKTTQKSNEALIWIGIVSILMFFGGLVSAYIVRRGEGGSWNSVALPYQFYFATAAILFSSIAIVYAYKNVKIGNTCITKQALLITFILGLLFAFFQFQAYGYLVSSGVYLQGNNPAASFLYIITFAHLLHLIAGILSVLFCLVKALRNRYTISNSHGLFVASIYWHFLGVLWVVLFLFLIFFR